MIYYFIFRSFIKYFVLLLIIRENNNRASLLENSSLQACLELHVFLASVGVFIFFFTLVHFCFSSMIIL